MGIALRNTSWGASLYAFLSRRLKASKPSSLFFPLSWKCFCAMAGPLLSLQEAKMQKHKLESLTANVFLIGVVLFLRSPYFTHLSDTYINILTAFYLCPINSKERNI